MIFGHRFYFHHSSILVMGYEISSTHIRILNAIYSTEVSVVNDRL